MEIIRNLVVICYLNYLRRMEKNEVVKKGIMISEKKKLKEG